MHIPWFCSLLLDKPHKDSDSSQAVEVVTYPVSPFATYWVIGEMAGEVNFQRRTLLVAFWIYYLEA